MVRTHDEFYLSEDRKDSPKEYFKFLASIFEKDLKVHMNNEVLDIGCATGEFIYYMSKRFPNNNYIGMDVLPQLLDKARINNPTATFSELNINSSPLNYKKKFDYIFMSGVHSIFETIEPWLNNLISLRKDNGFIYLFGIFNPEPLDVIIKSKKSFDKDNWETGWNMFSLETIRREIEKYNLTLEVIPWHIPIDIEKSEDPLRSWTIPTNLDMNRIIINGLQIIHHFYVIKITN